MLWSTFRNLLVSIRRPSQQARRRGKPRWPLAYRPRLEALEELVLLDAVRWINPAGGAWNVAANWDAGHVPGTGDDATIDLAGITVTHSTGTDSVNSLSISNGTFTLSGGSLHANTNIQGNSAFNFSGGTILNTTVAAGLTLRGSGGTLDGVTVNGDLDLTSVNNGAVYLRDGLTLNGTLSVGNASGSTFATVYFVNSQTIDGTGNVLFGGNANNSLRNYGQGITVTLGANLTVHGKNGFITLYQSNFTLINQGTIAADVAGGIINIQPTTWSSSGTLCAAGGTLNLGSTWSNTGMIRVDSGALTLGGAFTLDAASTYSRGGGTVNVTGTLNNANHTLTLNANTGSWNLSGTINGGTVTESGGAQLIVANGTLIGVTVNGDLDLTSVNNGAVYLRDGLTLNGTLSVGKADGSTYAYVNFLNTQTLDGTGSVLFGGNANNALRNYSPAITVTLGANLTVHGKSGQIATYQSNFTLINQGTIAADVAGGIINIQPTTWSSSGTLRAAGGTLNLGSTWSSSGLIDVSAGTLNLGGAFTLDAASTYSRGGGTVNVTGTLNNANHTLTLNANTGSWNLSGTINGGTVTESGGAQLIVANGTLIGVTVNGDLDLTSVNNGAVYLRDGLTLNGTLSVGKADGSTYAYVNFLNTQTLDGTGSVLFGGNANNALRNYSPAITVTLGANLTVHGKSGQIATYQSNFTLINQGTIAADVAGGIINIQPTTWSSSGTLRAAGGTLNLGSTWSNTGMIRVDSGALTLGGAFTLDAASTYSRGGGTVNLTGTLNNTGNTLALNAMTGSWNLSGTLNGGTVTESGGAQLFVFNGTLDGVTVNGDLDLTSVNNGAVYLRDGLTLNGTLSVGKADGSTYAYVNFLNTQTLDGTGSVLFGGNANNALRNYSPTITVTLGANLTVHGKSGQIATYQSNFTLVNQGTIAADVAGGTLTVSPTVFTNNGIVQARNGGILSAATPTNYASGTLTGGTWQVSGNSILRVTLSAGLVTNAATVLLDGANAHFYSNAGTADALAPLAAIADGGSITFQNGRDFTSAGDFSNTGFLEVGPASTVTVPGTYSVTGTLDVRATGTMRVTGAFANFTSGTLTGGAYLLNGGTFQFPGAAIATNAAYVLLTGPASQIIDQNGNDALAGLTANAPSGSILIQNGRNLTTAGAFENDGNLTIGTGSTLTVTGGDTDTGILTVLVSGTVNLAGGGASSGTINDAGTLTIGTGASLLVNGTLTDTGTITVPAGATLELAGSGGGNGNLSVAGTLLLDAGASFTLGGSYSQSGNLTVADTATLTLNGAFANFTSSTLTGGTYDILGTFQFTGANVVTNAANLILDGPDAQILDEAANNALANFATNAAGGSFTIQNGANLTTASAFSNAGNLTIGAGSTLNVGGNYVQTAGTTTLASGTLSASGLVDLQGGILSGSGTINASVRNAARIDVGGIGAAGLLSINGDYTQTAAGILNIEIGGHNPGVDYDQLTISGQATLDGTLNVSLINGFVPTSGDSFQILTAGTGVNGTFAGGTIDPAFLPPQYDPMDVTLVAS